MLVGAVPTLVVRTVASSRPLTRARQRNRRDPSAPATRSAVPSPPLWAASVYGSGKSTCISIAPRRSALHQQGSSAHPQGSTLAPIRVALAPTRIDPRTNKPRARTNKDRASHPRRSSLAPADAPAALLPGRGRRRRRNDHDHRRISGGLTTKLRIRIARRSAPRPVFHGHSGRERHRVFPEPADLKHMRRRLFVDDVAFVTQLRAVVGDDLGVGSGGPEQIVALAAAGVVRSDELCGGIDGQPEGCRGWRLRARRRVRCR
jgi:hypothetical protein